MRSWLFAIAARKAVDLHRARARAPQPVADVEPLAGGAEDELHDGDALAPVRTLPGKQREAVALRYAADLSHREIAEAMGTTEAAARRNVFEGLRRLRQLVPPDQTTEEP